MAKLLLNLRYVPDDEADEVRALLEERGIPFYETTPSFWGVSGGGIWISRDEDAASAEQLMAEYQGRRQARARAERRAAEDEGSAETLAASLLEHPLRTLAAILGIVFLIGLLVWPFLRLGE